MPRIIVKDHKYYFKIRGLGGPKGDKGDTGPAGPQGPQGPYVNVVAGTTTTLPAGSSAQVTVSNTGNTSVLNFGIPQGTKGDKGDAGTPGAQGPRGFAATVNVGETTTGQPGTNAGVVNAGNENDAVLKFTIPRGEKGETGETGPQGPTGGVKSTVVAELPETGESDKYYLVYRDSEGGTIATTDGYAQIENGKNGGDLTLDKLLGNAEQTTYSGKNLWNGAEPLAVTGYGTYALAKPLPAGTCTLSASSITTTGTGTYSLVMFLDSANQTVASDYVVFSTKQRSFTLTSEATQVRIYSQDGYQQSQGVTTTFTGIQIESGSTATSYEPYVGGTPAPNPDYPQPISVVTGEQTVTVTGKNLLDNKATTRTYLGVTLTKNDDGSITLNGTSTGNAQFYLDVDGVGFQGRNSHLDAGTYTINGRDSDGVKFEVNYQTANGNSKYSHGTFTVAEPFDYGVYVSVTNGTTVNNLRIYPQLELGSTATAYEPYQGQSYEVNLGGKNLFNAEYYATATYTSGAYKYTTTDFEGGKTYTFSATLKAGKTAMSGAYVCISDAANPNSTQNYMTPVYNGTPTVTHITATFASNATIYFQFYPTTLDIEQVFDTYDFQLEEGSARTPYQPFVPYHYELCKIGNYQDRIYKNDGKWYIEKQIGKVVLDGSENWTGSGYTNASIYSVYGGTPTIPDSPLLSSEFTYIGTIGSGTITEYVSSYNSSVLRLGVFKSRLQTADVAGLKTWLASHPTTVYYALATPTTTEITDETLLSQLNFLASLYEGTNNISLIGTGAQGEFTGNYVVYDKYNRHKVYIWSSDDNTWQIIVQ